MALGPRGSLMGGNVFKGVTSSLTREEAIRFVEDQLLDIMQGLDVHHYELVGSYKHGLGDVHDIDVIVMRPDVVDDRKRDEDVRVRPFKNELFEKLRPHGAVKGGSSVHVAWPVSPLMYEGPSDTSVQLDIFPVIDLWSADWLMRGVYRHMLFSLLARHASRGRKRVTVTVPGGVKVVAGSDVVVPRTSHPIIVARNLGLPSGEWCHVWSFGSLAESIASNDDLRLCLEGFREYTTHLAGRPDYEAHASFIDALTAPVKTDT